MPGLSRRPQRRPEPQPIHRNRGTVKTNSNPQATAATALSQLLTEHPEVAGLTWSIDTLGILHGEQYAETGHGQVVDDCAEILGGTAAHTVLSRAGDRLGLAQLATTWRDVPVHVWASYPETAIGGAQ